MNSPGELVKEKNMEVSTLLFLFTSYLQQNSTAKYVFNSEEKK